MEIDHGLIFAAIAVLGIGAQWGSWWLKLPAILPLLIIGLLVGPVTGLVDPEALLGDLLFPMVSLGVAIILFEGSLTLKMNEIKGLGRVVRNLVSVGALINWVVIGVATHYLVGLEWSISMLFGALVTVTGPTVIVPMLRTVRPNARISNILRWEGIIIDPLGALLAVLVYEFIVSGSQDETLWVFGKTLLFGGALGALAALALGFVMRRHLMPEYLHNVATLSLVLAVFSVSNAIVHESGLLAVTVMGMMLANMKNLHLDKILDFKESLTVLLISILFIVLAARVEFSQFAELGFGAIGILLVVIFVARPIAVWVSTLGSTLTKNEKLMIAWMGPRGIVAAAVSALFALRMEQFGDPKAALLVPLTFTVIIGTVVLQSLSSKAIAQKLGVAEPDPRGVLIIGAHKVAQAIAKALNAQGFRTVLSDTSWTNIREARMAGLQTYFGNAVSQHADRHMDLIGIGRLFAMSSRPALNSLAAVRFKTEFGAERIFSLRTAKEDDDSEKLAYADAFRSARLFGEDVSYSKLASMLSKGAEIRATQLSPEYTYEDYKTQQPGIIPMFALTGKGRLLVFSDDRDLKPESGWTVISMWPAAEKEQVVNGK